MITVCCSRSVFTNESKILKDNKRYTKPMNSTGEMKMPLIFRDSFRDSRADGLKVKQLSIKGVVVE
jgi:hypothetical protein